MNTTVYRNKIRQTMINEERNKELFRFSDYKKNGFGTDGAKIHFNRKPYSAGRSN